METKYFCGPELSEKLEQLGVISQLDFHICDDDEIPHQYRSEYCNGDFEQSFHWSDICLPENAKKIWGNLWYMYPDSLLVKVQENDWQTWLESEADQALKQSNHKEV